MARYERDYGRDFGRWGNRGPGPIGGMRSDGWGGSDWRDFPGEEGWYGQGYGRGSRDSWQGGGRAFQGGYGGRQEFDSGFEGDFGGATYDRGFRGNWGFEGGAGGGEFGRGGYGGQRGYGSDFGYQGGAYDAHRGYGSDFGYQAGGYGGRNLEPGWSPRESSYEQGGGGWGSGRESGFGRSRAAEIMTENPESVTADSSISEVARKMRDLDVGIIPVVDSQENRRLRGVITDRDVTIRAVAEGRDGETKVGDCMTDRVRAVNKNDPVQEVMRVMREEQVRRVPVTDREGRLVGIIAQADLAVDFAGHDRGREIEVSETLERISEPARPERSGNAMAASGRGSTQREESTARQNPASGGRNQSQETAE